MTIKQFILILAIFLLPGLLFAAEFERIHDIDPCDVDWPMKAPVNYVVVYIDCSCNIYPCPRRVEGFCSIFNAVDFADSLDPERQPSKIHILGKRLY